MPKITNLKVSVKNGTMSARRALEIMRKRVSWEAGSKDSRTANWLRRRAGIEA